MTLQSQLGTINSTLARSMTLGVPLVLDPLSPSVYSTLALVSSAQGILDEQKPSSTLSLIHTAIAVRDIPLLVSHSITFTSLISRSLTLSASNNLLVEDFLSHFNYVADRTPVGNVLNLSQTVTLQDSKFVDHALDLIQSVSVRGPYRLSVITPLALGQHTSTPYHMWSSDSLGLSDMARTPIATQHITQTLNLIQVSPVGNTWTTLNLSQSALFAFAYAINQTLNITDQLNLEGVWIRSVEHSDIVGHSLTWYEDTKCGRKQYTPFQGENTIPTSFTPPSNTLQDPQGDTGNFSIYTPYLGVATSKVTIRKPELDNRDRNAYTRVNQETRGGRLIVYSDPQWPSIRTLAITIIGLSENEVDEFQTFMEATIGQDIGLTDWEGRLWKGVITNPNEAAVQDGKCRWTITFEFEGELLTVEQPEYGNGEGQAMNITQSVEVVLI